MGDDPTKSDPYYTKMFTDVQNNTFCPTQVRTVSLACKTLELSFTHTPPLLLFFTANCLMLVHLAHTGPRVEALLLIYPAGDRALSYRHVLNPTVTATTHGPTTAGAAGAPSATAVGASGDSHDKLRGVG